MFWLLEGRIRTERRRARERPAWVRPRRGRRSLSRRRYSAPPVDLGLGAGFCGGGTAEGGECLAGGQRGGGGGSGERGARERPAWVRPRRGRRSLSRRRYSAPPVDLGLGAGFCGGGTAEGGECLAGGQRGGGGGSGERGARERPAWVRIEYGGTGEREAVPTYLPASGGAPDGGRGRGFREAAGRDRKSVV